MTSAINTNLNSLTAQRQLGLSASVLGTAMQRLSSGLRINSAKDDAAGLAISERFTTQIKGTDQAARNTNDAISLAQTADGALASISSNLQRMRELAVQAANSTNSAADRAALQNEVSQLVTENDRIASQTEFNGNKLLDGSFNGQTFQVGANRQQTVAVSAVGSMRSDTLGQYNGFNDFFDYPIAIGAAAPLTLTIDGTAINLGTVAADGKAVADAINHSGVAGLSADSLVSYHATGGQQNNAGAVSGTAVYTINGVAIKLDYTPDSSATGMSARKEATMAAINAQSAFTGVFAEYSNTTSNGERMMGLYAPDGRNIITSFSAGTATGSLAKTFGLDANVAETSYELTMTYQAPPGTAHTSISVTGAALAFTMSSTVLPAGTALNQTNVSTIAGANAAINSIDAALVTVNATRANVGALQNRFASTISNLQASSENLSAARSRITDADFAQETANLSRAQILQQAGTAMVAQANQSPQGVLALLR